MRADRPAVAISGHSFVENEHLAEARSAFFEIEHPVKTRRRFFEGDVVPPGTLFSPFESPLCFYCSLSLYLLLLLSHRLTLPKNVGWC